jgi:ketosteroid isomerase-like protein
MAKEITNRFMEALQAAERQHNPEPLLPFFSEQSELINLSREEPRRGLAGARAFWRDYLSFFENIRSQFYHVIETNDAAVLEWSAEGKLKSGGLVSYRGTSILEMEDSKVLRFRTYYDSAALLRATA